MSEFAIFKNIICVEGESFCRGSSIRSREAAPATALLPSYPLREKSERESEREREGERERGREAARQSGREGERQRGRERERETERELERERLSFALYEPVYPWLVIQVVSDGVMHATHLHQTQGTGMTLRIRRGTSTSVVHADWIAGARPGAIPFGGSRAQEGQKTEFQHKHQYQSARLLRWHVNSRVVLCFPFCLRAASREGGGGGVLQPATFVHCDIKSGKSRLHVQYRCNYYLLKNPKRKENNNSYITLKKEECFYFFGVAYPRQTSGGASKHTEGGPDYFGAGTITVPHEIEIACFSGRL